MTEPEATVLRWFDRGISHEPPHEPVWPEVPAATEMSRDERDRWIYRVAAEVSQRVKGVNGWRTMRSGCAINVWMGPDRQRSRHPDYTIWVENNIERHLHQPSIAAKWDAEALDRIASLLRDGGDATSMLAAITDVMKPVRVLGTEDEEG